MFALSWLGLEESLKAIYQADTFTFWRGVTPFTIFVLYAVVMRNYEMLADVPIFAQFVSQFMTSVNAERIWWLRK